MSLPFPEVYATKRPLHDDWPWPLSLIPRRWTGVAMPMGPKVVWGTQKERWIQVQDGYDLAPDVLRDHTEDESHNYFWGADPVPAIGQWSVQSHWSPFFKRRIPCYFTGSWKVFGRRLHVNFGVKADVTPGDFWHWIEGSLTWTKIATHEPQNKS